MTTLMKSAQYIRYTGTNLPFTRRRLELVLGDEIPAHFKADIDGHLIILSS